jgi:methylmalonyl-CoA carboxyltransferase large subunit
MTRHTKIDLGAEVQELRQGVEKLVAMLAAALAKETPAPSAASAVAGKAKVDEGIAPEIVLAITAAVAAFLGKRATIHQIRLTGTTAWAMQGRATVQASHGQVRWSR